MDLASVVKWFMPKEEKFRGLLALDTQNLLRATRSFSEVAGLDGSLEGRRAGAAELKAAEHEGDRITRQIFEALNSSFITPFDREDLRSLAMDLDDIVDYIEDTGQYLVLFELAESQPALRDFAAILVGLAEQIDTATGLVWNMANQKPTQDCIVRVSELENQADALYNRVTAELFTQNGREPTDILKWKVVYDGLEAACDQCKKYSNVLGNVLIKYA